MALLVVLIVVYFHRLEVKTTATATTTTSPTDKTTATTTRPTAITTPTPRPPELPKYFTNSIGMKFVIIPAGSFTMGSPEGEGIPDEHPRHRVEITKPFYLGVYEVTQAQWRAVMGRNPSGFMGDNRPVDLVSWNDVQGFIGRLNQKERTDKYRLPTEAEWEYACRAGSGTDYCFGDDESRLGDYAWWWDNSGNQTHSVGLKKPNAWGLYDMYGNVGEWCADWYGKDYYAHSPSSDPRGPGSGEFRIMRGCFYEGWHCRSASRMWFWPHGGDRGSGFRLARTTP